MYKVVPFSFDSTNPNMLQEMLNGFLEDGFELVNVLEYEQGVKLMILSDEKKRLRRLSFGAGPMND